MHHIRTEDRHRIVAHVADRYFTIEISVLQKLRRFDRHFSSVAIRPGIDEPPSLTGFFNEMKQEFASARWLLFEALHAGHVHFSDRCVALHNTLDYPSNALAVE
jgi:hypothetical protein